MDEPRRYRFTATEYMRLVDAGILTENHNVELFNGEIVCLEPITERHAVAVLNLSNLMARQIMHLALIDVHNPLWLDDMSIPEPDIALILDKEYRDTFPTPAEVFVVVEVADWSLAYDRDVKFPRYAATGIPEAWLVDVNANIIKRHSHPFEDTYRHIAIARPGDMLSSTVLSDLTVPVSAILGMGRTK